MNHKHPEIEASLRSLAVNFSVGNVPLDALASRLTALAEQATREHDRTRKATDTEARVLRNAVVGFPLDAGIVEGAATAIRTCVALGWLGTDYTATPAGIAAAGISLPDDPKGG